MKDGIAVFVVDDHEMVREGIKVMLSTDPELKVVGTASNGEEAVALVDKCKPNVVLMDVRMPGMDGIEATRLIKRNHGGVSVVMLTVYENEVYITEAVEAGAAGYLLKGASRDLLCHTVHAVYQGGALLPGPLLKETLDSIRSSEGRGRRSVPGTIAALLTPREQEVLGLIVEGMANKQIAAALTITEDTVKKHVQSITAKLGVSDRTQAAVKAVHERFGVAAVGNLRGSSQPTLLRS